MVPRTPSRRIPQSMRLRHGHHAFWTQEIRGIGILSMPRQLPILGLPSEKPLACTIPFLHKGEPHVAGSHQPPRLCSRRRPQPPPSVAATSRTAFADEAAEPAQWDASLPSTWDREAEMVVVGCGIAGTCALLEGYELGLDALGIEAGDDIKKCSCKLSGGWFAGACTSLQDDAGIVDDVELMVKAARNDGGDFGDPDVIRAWCELSGETIDWLWDLGVDLVPQVFDAKSAELRLSARWPRRHQADPVGDGLGWMTRHRERPERLRHRDPLRDPRHQALPQRRGPCGGREGPDRRRRRDERAGHQGRPGERRRPGQRHRPVGHLRPGHARHRRAGQDRGLGRTAHRSGGLGHPAARRERLHVPHHRQLRRRRHRRSTPRSPATAT